VFTSHLQGMTSEDRVAFARFAGIAEDAVRMLESPHGIYALGTDSVERAGCVLSFDARQYLHPSTPGPLTRGQYDALLDFAHAAKLEPPAIKRLRREAERQQMAGVLRFGLLELREWAAFRDELRERGVVL
jgi:hypothetical protein